MGLIRLTLADLFRTAGRVLFRIGHLLVAAGAVSAERRELTRRGLLINNIYKQCTKEFRNHKACNGLWMDNVRLCRCKCHGAV